MNGHALGYVYGWGLALFSLSVLPPLILAIADQETTTLAGFLVTGLIAGFIGVALIIALKQQDSELNRREKIVLLIALWLSYSALAAIPFEASGVIPSRLNAIFEATSALTTTGASVMQEVALTPRSILLWRAELQWIGGFLTLLTITFLLLRLWGAERAEQEISTTTKQGSTTLHHLYVTIKLILPLYLGLTAAFTLALLLCGLPLFDAASLVLTSISTGGMAPREGPLLSYGNVAILYVLSIAMFFGAVSILWSHYLFTKNWLGLKKFNEPLWVGGAMLALAIAALWMKFSFQEGREFAGLSVELATALYDATSLISTTGTTASAHSLQFIPASLLLVIMLVGGGVISTAGGIKFTRVKLMFRQSWGELRSLIYPHEVRPLYLSKEEKDQKYLSTIWVIFGLSILTLVALSAILAYYGLGLEAALFTAASALSNCGPCLAAVENQHAIGTPAFIELASPAKIAFISAMVIGRLEFLMALSLLQTAFWRH